MAAATVVETAPAVQWHGGVRRHNTTTTTPTTPPIAHCPLPVAHCLLPTNTNTHGGGGSGNRTRARRHGHVTIFGLFSSIYGYIETFEREKTCIHI